MMKLIKIFIAFCLAAFFMTSTVMGQQANATIQVLPGNSGQVPVNGILSLQITVGNTGTDPYGSARLRPLVTVPGSVTFLANALQDGLPVGWTILTNTGSQLRICNTTDPLGSTQSRTIFLKVQAGPTVTVPQTFQGQINFGNGTTCANGPATPGGNNIADDAASSTIEVIAAAACTISATSSITGPISCFGGTTTLTAASAGTSNPVEYSINGTTFQTSPSFTVTAGTYTVTAREVATITCSATATPLIVTQPTAIVASATSTPVGAVGGTNGTATVTASGGTAPYSYAWAPGGQTTATATGLMAGSYTVTVTDANLCTQTATTTVVVATCNLALTTAAPAIACNGGNTIITATATGATGAVEYSLNGGAFQAGNTFTVTAGNYTVTAREVANNLCTSSSIINVTQPTALVASATSTAILCNGGTSTVTVSATGGTAPYTGTGTFTRSAGAYSYTVTDANGCTSIASGTITQPMPIVVTATFPLITTFGGTTTVTVAATGGTAPYTGTGAIANVVAGTYTYTVTDANGCTGSTTVVIASTPPVIADPATGQMNFVTLSNAGQSANTLLFTQDYRLRIPFYNLSQTDAVPNGTIRLTISLGSKLQLATGFNLATASLSDKFTWTSTTVADSVVIIGTQIAPIPEDFEGTLIFNVKGKLSCTSNISTRIDVVNLTALLTDEDFQNNAATLQYTLPVTVTTTQVNVTCFGANNGIINIIASPGTTSVVRNSAGVIVGTTGLMPGVYTVTTTATGDAPLSNVCSSTTTVTIVQPALLVTSLVSTVNNTCNAGTDGILTVTSTGGTAPYRYTIAGPTVNVTGFTSGIFTGLSAGTYTITATDANGCTATVTATVTQPLGIAPNISLGSDITSSFFPASGTSQTIVYNVSEIAGNPSVGDTIRITRVTGFTINLNTAIFSTVVGGTTYNLDNSRWKIDNSNSAFVSIILTDPSNPANPGTLLCNERVNVAVTLTRNTTDVSTFTLSARLRRSNGELILTNNLNSIIMTAE